MSGRTCLRAAAVALAASVLAGCAGVTPDGGFDTVAAMARERTGLEARVVQSDAEARALAARIRAMLAEPLGVEQAVAIALLNNPGLQATYWQAGIAQADLAQAARLPNPALGFKHTVEAGDVALERTLTVDLVRALTLPLSRRIEQRRFEQTRLQVAAAIERHAYETRRAWYEAVAAQQGVDYARQVNGAAEAAAELSARMAQAGNASQLDLAREQAFHAEASAGVARAARAATAAREHLTRLLGLWGEDTAYTLPARLPALPAAPAELQDIERIALTQRLDVQAAKLEAAATASALGLTRATRLVNVFDLGYVRNSAGAQPAAKGYEVTLELPLFDWGGARVARAEAIYMQAVNRVAQAALDARSEARENYLAYRTAYDLALHYRDHVIPLRRKISQEVLLRYNGMLASTFDLLADAREQAAAVNASIDAQKEFWLAHASLEAALGQRVAASPAKEQAQ